MPWLTEGDGDQLDRHWPTISQEMASRNTHYAWYDEAPGTTGTGVAQATPVTPTFDPKIDANQLYGKHMALSAMGYARIGASPAPIVGPYIHGDQADFLVSFGVPANVEGDRKIYKIYLDNELAWSSDTGGTLPGDGTFSTEPFDFVFKPGTLTQSVCSLESEHFPGDEVAYRPQMLLEIRNLPTARWMAITGKPIPYVAVDIGDVTDGADPVDGINLGYALSLIAWSPWAGGTEDTFESVGIMDVVDAILIKDNFTIIDLCQSVTREYRNIDLLLSDKIRIKDRGATVAPSFVFDRDSIIGGDEEIPVAVTRAGATDQRREHELIAIDPDQDYTGVPSLSKIPRDPMVISAAVGKDTATIPLVIDANTRQALATFAQNYEENARRKVAIKVPPLGYEIEPGDLFAVTNIADGFDAEVFKCVQTTHGANWIVELEGEAILRCSIYGDTVIFIGATWDPATVADVTLSGSNLVATNTGTSSLEQGAHVAAASGKTSGKYYFELTPTVGGIGSQRAFGIGPPTSNFTDLGNAVGGCLVYHGSGQIWANGVNTGVGPMSIAEGWHLRIAVDLDNRKIWFSTLAPSASDNDWNNNPANDPAANVGGITIPGSGAMVPFCSFGGVLGSSGQVATANFGGASFFGLVPSGFLPGWPI